MPDPPQLSSFCRQLKLVASDGKQYLTDCIDQRGIDALMLALPSKYSTVDEIIDKYVEMNIAHPFMEGNGRATRIWLDMLLKLRLGLCVDWQLIDKQEYLRAMEQSVVDAKPLHGIISNALTNRVNDRELFMKGIDYSYYYEEIED